MEAVRIILSGLWVALMLTYLLGDVLRIFAGDFKPGEISGMQATQGMFFCRHNSNVNSDRYGCPVSDIEVSSDTLGNHHSSSIPPWF